jgi:phytoene dehydrogenase-like protein
MSNSNTFDAIIIGAGFGGATCAALLAKAGKKVLVIEKNNLAGGKAMSHTRKGFSYSPWPIIGAPIMGSWAEKLVTELGIQEKAKLVTTQGRPIYKTPDGKYKPMPEQPTEALDPNVLFDWMDIPADQRDISLGFMMTMLMMSPEDVAKLEGTDFHSWILQFNLPQAIYAFIVSNCLDGMYMVPADELDCAEAISGLQKVFIGGGGQFCSRGWGEVAEGCCDVVRANGGTVIMGTRLKKIVIQNGVATGVETEDGKQFHSSTIISNAGIQPTILNLAGAEHFDNAYVERIKSLKPSHALLGYRYFLSRPVLKDGFGVVFSNTSPWSKQRFEEAHAGKASREGVLYIETPSNYDAGHAPEGKQLVLTGSFCPADPEMSKEDIKAWADAGEEIVFGAYPEIRDAIEERILYTTKSVSNATRDSAVPGAGGETIGIAQIVGQCGKTKPSIQTPVKGLYIVGTDAGAPGVGTQQAIESGYIVSKAILGG